MKDPKPADAKYMDLIGALDSARQRALEEVKALKEEIRGLNDMVGLIFSNAIKGSLTHALKIFFFLCRSMQMKEKDNYIMRKESGGTWRPSQSAQAGGGAGEGGQGLQHLIETVRDLEK